MSSSERYRPSATLIGSTSPTRSAIEMSGVASFSLYRWSGVSQTSSTESPSFATRYRQAAQIGANGSSLISQPAMAGTTGSSSETRERAMRVFACPRSPRKMMS